MEDYQLLIDLHKRAKRQGPGGDAETRKAIDLAMLDPSAPFKIADIGCGTGSSAMLLARALNAQITAVDFLPDFVEVLKANTESEGLTKKIDPLV
jgi:predicted O-methyltransferase YrrM